MQFQCLNERVNQKLRLYQIPFLLTAMTQSKFEPFIELFFQELICYLSKPLTCQYNSAQQNMKQGFEAQTDSTLSLASRLIDVSTNYITANRDQSGEDNLYPRIDYPGLQHMLANSFSKTIKKEKDILTQVISLISTNIVVEQKLTNEKKKQQKVGQEASTQQPGLLNLNGRLRSVDKQMFAYSLKVRSSQEIENNQQIEQKEYRSDSKTFSKIKGKVSYESEAEVKQNPECFRDKLLKQMKLLKEKINKAEKELQQKQIAWAHKQSSLHQQLSEERESLQKYIEQVRQLEAQNKFLTSQKEKREKQQKERALFYRETIEKSASERITVKEISKKTEEIDLPKLTSQKHSSSNIECKKTKVSAGSSRYQVTFFNLLNELRKYHLNQSQRQGFRQKIAKYL